jgi:ATP-dependent protease HslVU (ClpYQ) peptidase subunit
MTTIAAIEGPDWVIIGADSMSSGEDGFSIAIPDGKIFNNNNIVFAGCGAVRGINILQHDFTPPEVDTDDIDKYITKELIPAMRNTFIEAGYELNKAESSVENDNVWIVVIKGKVYRIDSDYSWERTSDNMYVAGSGERFALGAMSALANGVLVDDYIEARKIVSQALVIASKYDSSTGGKLTVLLIEEKKNA